MSNGQKSNRDLRRKVHEVEADREALRCQLAGLKDIIAAFWQTIPEPSKAHHPLRRKVEDALSEGDYVRNKDK